jgi:hypothetical protein
MSTTEPTRPEGLELVVGDEEAADEVREADLRNGEPRATATPPPTASPSPAQPPATSAPSGTDTPTGTDPDATYDHPGYEDKSLGQAVQQDRELVDRLLDEEDGDERAAAERFGDESAGRTTLERQDGEHGDGADAGR